MEKPFIDELMRQIMEARMIPKVQVERAVGPILGMFLADVLTETLKQYPQQAGTIEMVCPEFPFKKLDNNQSTNIDFLLYNRDQKKLLFVELKTSDTSVDIHQVDMYRIKQREVREKSGATLHQDLEIIRDASSERGKYQFIIENKIESYKKELAQCYDASIIYLVPESAESNVKKHADLTLTFGGLAASIEGPYAEEWQIIKRHLCDLDASSKRIRNLAFSPPTTPTERINYLDKCSFEEILMLCEEFGNDIAVGFSGGENELAGRDLASLENRLYKWDDAKGGTGKKEGKNWIRGNTFLNFINIKKKYAKPVPLLNNEQRKRRSANWQGTYKFDEMVAHCAEYGDKVIIGFVGGKSGFARSSLDYLKDRRHYKWDYAENRSGKNVEDWISGDWVVKTLKEHHGYYPSKPF